MEGVVDTNVLVSAIVKEDVNHEKARLILERMEKWYIPGIVFHELVWFFKSQELSPKIAESVLNNEKAEFVPVLEEDVYFSLRNAKNLRDYNDYLILSISIRKKKMLISFDTELRRNCRRFKVKIYP